MRYKIRHPGTMEWIFGDDKDALEEKWFEGFNRALLNDNPQDVITSSESQIRELKNQVTGLQFELKAAHNVAIENKELRDKLETSVEALESLIKYDTSPDYGDSKMAWDMCVNALEKLRSGK